MGQEGFRPKLAAILISEVKEYARLMDEDEGGTLRALDDYRKMIDGLLQRYRGRIVGVPRDRMLVEFASVADAVLCAVEIQKESKNRNANVPENRKIEFRIGVHFGEVIEEGENIHGKGIDIAALVTGLAEAGGICITGAVHGQVQNKLPLLYEYMGEQDVKNALASLMPNAKVERVRESAHSVYFQRASVFNQLVD